MYAAYIIIIMNIILRGFPEHITDVMENFFQTVNYSYYFMTFCGCGRQQSAF